MNSRQQFEERFPVPFNAEWSDEHQRYVWNKKSNSLTAAMEHSKIWDAWQASRQSLVVELSEPDELSSPDGWCEYDYAKSAIEASGITVRIVK